MLTFLSSIALLILGYIVYAKVVERIFSIDPSQKTPAYTKEDGLDYVPMPWWKGWLIQLWGPTNEKRKTYAKEFVQITLGFVTPYK